MSLKIIFLLCFSLCIPVFIILLYIYSVYTNKKDLKLKEMLAEANSAGRNIDEVFILEKSFVAICFMFTMSLYSIGFLASLLFFNHSFLKTSMYLFAFIACTLGFVSAFCDYFLSMIVISKCRMYVRCLTTLYRPIVVALDGRYRYEDIRTGMFGLYIARYAASISMPSGSYVVMNVNNKKQLRDVLNRINSTSGVAAVEGAVPI